MASYSSRLIAAVHPGQATLDMTPDDSNCSVTSRLIAAVHPGQATLDMTPDDSKCSVTSRLIAAVHPGQATLDMTPDDSKFSVTTFCSFSSSRHPTCLSIPKAKGRCSTSLSWMMAAKPSRRLSLDMTPDDSSSGNTFCLFSGRTIVRNSGCSCFP